MLNVSIPVFIIVVKMDILYLVCPERSVRGLSEVYEKWDDLRSESRKSQGRLRKSQSHKAIAFVTEEPIAPVFIDGRSTRFEAKNGKRRRNHGNNEDEGLEDEGLLLDGGSSSFCMSTSSWHRKRKEHIFKDFDRPSTSHALVKDFISTTRPNTRGPRPATTHGTLALLDPLGRKEREEMAAALISMDNNHVTSNRTRMLISKSAPHLKQAEEVLEGSKPRKDHQQANEIAREIFGDEDYEQDEALPRFEESMIVKNQAEMSYAILNELSECGEDLRQQRTEYFQRYYKEERPNRIRFDKMLQERRSLEIQRIAEEKKARERKVRSKKWDEMKSIRKALLFVEKEAKIKEVKKMRAMKKDIKQRKHTNREQLVAETAQRILESKKRLRKTKLPYVPPRANILAKNVFPDSLAKELKKQHYQTGKEAFPAPVQGTRRILGGGFNQKNASIDRVWGFGRPGSQILEPLDESFWSS